MRIDVGEKDIGRSSYVKQAKKALIHFRGSEEKKEALRATRIDDRMRMQRLIFMISTSKRVSQRR